MLKSRDSLLKKVQCLSSNKEKISNKEKSKIIFELRHEFNLDLLLHIANLPRSTYYYHKKRFNFPDKYEAIKEHIKELYHKNRGRYGYRRITALLKNKGIKINHKTVYRLMKEMNISSKVRMKKYKSYKGEVGRIAPNLLNRNFYAEKPNQKWVTDVTEFSLFGQKLYLSPLLDLYNGEIISYTISERPVFKQVMDMLDKAFDKCKDLNELIIHSDQGWQYQMKRYQKKLKDKGINQSMSRKGNCLDNAVIENFFGHLKTELLYLEKFKDINHFKKELIDYIHWYNTERIKIKLKGLSPVEYRTKSLSVA